MDASRFDLLAKSFFAAGSRRGVVRLLAALPMAGGLAALLAEEESEAAGRRKRRKKRHKHQRRRRKENRKGKRKGKDKGKKKCTKAGGAPKKGRPCCDGLSPDGTGLCAAAGPAPACGDVCASGCAFTSIQDAIDAAGPGATIRICAGTYVETIVVNEDVTLAGAGDGDNPSVDTIVDGNNALVPVVTVPDDRTVALSRLRITGGGNGGVDSEGDLTMTNCTVADNASLDGGGGITSNAGSLTMTDCAVTGNSTQDDIGSGGISSHGDLTMTGCTVSGNTTRITGAAGGIRLLERGATLTNCAIGPDNEAGVGGGGIYIFGGITLTLDGTTVSGNRSISPSGRGGGVLVDGGATLRLLNGSRVTGNETAGNGGGIFNFGGNVELDASFIGPDNTAAGNGGGIFNDVFTFITPVPGNVSLSGDSSVTGNHAVGDGGGILNEGTVDCAGGTVIGNTAGDPAVDNDCVDVDGDVDASGCADC